MAQFNGLKQVVYGVTPMATSTGTSLSEQGDGRPLFTVYVTNSVGGRMSVIDTATNAVSATIAVGVGAIGVAVIPGA